MDQQETPVVEDQTTEPAVIEESAPSTEQAVQPVEPAPNGAQTEVEPAAEQVDGKRDTKAERRIGKLTHRAKQAEETVQNLEAENAALQRQLGGLTPPSDDDYGSVEHTAAVVRHATQEANIQGRLDANDREKARLQHQYEQQLLGEVVDKVTEFSAKTPDYSDSVAKLASLQNLSGSVVQLDNTPEVYYALSKDLNLAVALNQMPEGQRLIELGRLSAEVTVKPVTVSGAPPPVQSAQGGTAVSGGGLHSNMSMDEFSTWHDKQNGMGA